MGGQFHPRKNKMDAFQRPSSESRRQNAPALNPSFVYRQDGYELSYKTAEIFYYKQKGLSIVFVQPVEQDHLTQNPPCL